MISNKKSLDPDLIYDGAILIWNIGVNCLFFKLFKFYFFKKINNL